MHSQKERGLYSFHSAHSLYGHKNSKNSRGMMA